jgi:hypothetical protein
VVLLILGDVGRLVVAEVLAEEATRGGQGAQVAAGEALDVRADDLEIRERAARSCFPQGAIRGAVDEAVGEGRGDLEGGEAAARGDGEFGLHRFTRTER